MGGLCIEGRRKGELEKVSEKQEEEWSALGCYAAKCFQKGKLILGLRANLSNPKTSVLELPSQYLAVSCCFHLCETIQPL